MSDYVIMQFKNDGSSSAWYGCEYAELPPKQKDAVALLLAAGTGEKMVQIAGIGTYYSSTIFSSPYFYLEP